MTERIGQPRLFSWPADYAAWHRTPQTRPFTCRARAQPVELVARPHPATFRPSRQRHPGVGRRRSSRKPRRAGVSGFRRHRSQPTAGLRTTLRSRAHPDRQRDGSRFDGDVRGPRSNTSSAAIFFRFVAVRARSPRALEDRDPERDTGRGVKDAGFVSNGFRMDWLFSYRPIPGTLVYFGYGLKCRSRRVHLPDLQRTQTGSLKISTCSALTRSAGEQGIATRIWDASPSHLTMGRHDPSRQRPTPRRPDVGRKCSARTGDTRDAGASEAARPDQGWALEFGFNLGRPTEEDRRRECGRRVGGRDERRAMIASSGRMVGSSL